LNIPSEARELYPHRGAGATTLIEHPERSEGTLPFVVMSMKQRTIPYYYVYLLSSLSGTLYVGLTDNLRQRILEHKLGTYDGFTKRYGVNRLMYFETYRADSVARAREKQIKKYSRRKKIALFIKTNPQWKDLSRKILLAA